MVPSSPKDPPTKKNHSPFAGVRARLFDGKHYDRMGVAVFLFGWLISEQTGEQNGVGIVHFGQPLTDKKIAELTGYSERNVRAWRSVLETGRYIRTERLTRGLVYSILNAKKFSLGVQSPILGPVENSSVIHRISTEGSTENCQSDRQNTVNQSDRILSITTPQNAESSPLAEPLALHLALHLACKPKTQEQPPSCADVEKRKEGEEKTKIETVLSEDAFWSAFHAAAVRMAIPQTRFSEAHWVDRATVQRSALAKRFSLTANCN